MSDRPEDHPPGEPQPEPDPGSPPEPQPEPDPNAPPPPEATAMDRLRQGVTHFIGPGEIVISGSANE